MNIETHKNQIINKLKKVQDEKLLGQVKAVLNGTLIVAYNADGEPLTSDEYMAHIESISDFVADGAETYTSEQVRNAILS